MQVINTIIPNECVISSPGFSGNSRLCRVLQKFPDGVSLKRLQKDTRVWESQFGLMSYRELQRILEKLRIWGLGCLGGHF